MIVREKKDAKKPEELIAKRIFIMIENAHVTSDQSKNIGKGRKKKRERERARTKQKYKINSFG